MTDTKEFFNNVTQRIFSNWTALKMAVEYGMGTKDGALEFCAYMTEVMYMNDNLDSNEVAGELEDYMDEHFNTQLEDNSAIQVAEELLRFYHYCVEKNESVAVAELQKLPPQQSWISSNEPRIRSINNTRAQQDESSSSDEEDATHGSMEVGDDEWTEVKTRQKR